MSDEFTSEIMSMPLIALRGVNVFPQTEVRFDVERQKSILAIDTAMNEDGLVFLVNQKDPEVDLPTAKDLYTMGTVAKIKRVLKLPGEHIRVLVIGQYRARLRRMLYEMPYFHCSVSRIDDIAGEPGPEAEALIRTCANLYGAYRKAHPRFPSDEFHGFERPDDPGYIADFVVTQMDIKASEAHKVLIAQDPVKRLKLVVKYLVRETEISKLEGQINEKIQTRLTKAQRESYLREQIKTIQEELGNKEDIGAETAEWRKQLKKLKLPQQTAAKIEKEIDRAEKLPSYAPDLSVLRTYINTVLELPWHKRSAVSMDIARAQEILDEDHYGLEKVKDRILEYLAVQTLAKDLKSPILCLVGPPGVGKTSIARSIARSVDRQFVHMSLGGVRDEAEIRGHRRTYVGAIPGRVMSAIKECGYSDPVFLFDEVDKIGSDFRGDPASALLEVLDPEQNKEFMDHYLEVPFDLSNVMFITTANTTDTIPRPLLDRMEVIELSGYTSEEKLNIAQKYLIPKQIKANGLKQKNISIHKDAVEEIINSYTRESGVRGLEKQIAGVCRKVARMIVAGDESRQVVTAKNIEEYLGNKRFHYDKILEKNEIGVSTGLAWTVVGGDTLFIETACMPGSGHIQLTGQLGDVMQESAKAAISYIRAHASDLGVDEEFYKNKDIHIHIPEGATPKDGPSAGVTMCVSVLSALTGRAVRKNVAMTGEISLRGKILPVGGIKEKMIAAHRLGIKKVLLPADNERDLDDLPKTVHEQMEFVLISEVGDAVREALI
jgi:ATP-dependent Lon protease